MIASRRALGSLALLGSMVAVYACSDTERSFETDNDSGITADDDSPDADDDGDGNSGDAGEPDADDDVDPTDGGGVDDDDAGTTPEVDGGGTGPDGGLLMSCMERADCDDDNVCNGRENCIDNACVAGEIVDDGESCELADSEGNHFCVSGNCAPSRCGDGVTDADADEACDDGNLESGDGCEPNCTFSCTSGEDCNDSNICNGDETCEDHQCVPGENLDDGANCGTERVCNAGRCVPEGCGDGVTTGEEQCDDSNLVDGDGCDSDCTYTCETDEECSDGDACNGTETCDLTAHTCKAGEDVVCDPPDACHEAACEPQTGRCIFLVIDKDGDKHASTELGACGTDCNDNDKTVYTGAEELCDEMDNNCNGKIDEDPPTWYLDCDGDGYAPVKAPSVKQCKPPPAVGCQRGQAATWTSVAPGAGTTDCWDQSNLVHPMNSTENAKAWSSNPIKGRDATVDFDYNCEKGEEKRFTESSVLTTARCSGGVILQPADATFMTQGDFALYCGPEGYIGKTVPECGFSATYTYCDIKCNRQTRSQIQLCR